MLSRKLVKGSPGDDTPAIRDLMLETMSEGRETCFSEKIMDCLYKYSFSPYTNNYYNMFVINRSLHFDYTNISSIFVAALGTVANV